MALTQTKISLAEHQQTGSAFLMGSFCPHNVLFMCLSFLRAFFSLCSVLDLCTYSIRTPFHGIPDLLAVLLKEWPKKMHFYLFFMVICWVARALFNTELFCLLSCIGTRRWNKVSQTGVWGSYFVGTRLFIRELLKDIVRQCLCC